MLESAHPFRIGSLLAAILFVPSGPALAADEPLVQFIYTSDVHFGLQTRGSFQGSAGPVPAWVVNQQAVQAMNRLPGLVTPQDQGVHAGEPLGAFTFLAITGDLANRQEAGPPAIQSAALSWRQFQATYGVGLTLKDPKGAALPLYLTPGNHDVSNAIGYPEPLNPATDATAMVGIYNAAFPQAPIRTEAFDYTRHKVFFAHDFGGIHFLFLNMWPDSDMRARIDRDLRQCPDPAGTPVILLMHMPPGVEAKNFADPASAGGRFVFSHGYQNLLVDVLAASDQAPGKKAVPAQELAALTAFLAEHKTITAWFHGHENYQEFSRWPGLHGELALPVFRVDSPMKGRESSLDETKLSFQVVSIDPGRKLMTVRECLWNTTRQPNGPLRWGASTTLSLAVPRPDPPMKP